MSNQTTPGIEIFLGKGGQTYGPYTVEQFEELKASSDFRTYTYIWDGRDANPQWKALEPPPAALSPRKPGPGAPPPDEQHPARAAAPAEPVAAAEPVEQPVRAAQPAPQPARQPMLRGYDVPGLEAACHDAHAVVTGKLFAVTDSGCELVTDQALSEPVFGSQARVTLNLLDPRSGKSMNVAARLNGVRRKNGTWSYKVLWKGCPELVLQQLEKSA